MNIQENIETYIASHPEPKRSEMESLHQIILRAMPDCTLWYLDGKNDEGKIVSNPNIGYGHRQRTLTDINVDVLETAIRDGAALNGPDTP
ncbi:MAG: hypothetical protein IPF59_03270 [Ignavibacteria bacterium]|nr:hypothetical protein [Ignavibacteria bacterium]